MKLSFVFKAKPEVSFKLHVNFGYRESSPIPYKQTGHKNLESVVPAVPGTKAELFPGKRTECIEFLSYIEDENGTPCGIRCNFRECSESLEKVLLELGILQKSGYEKLPVTELELFVGETKILEDTSFNDGVTTLTYRHFRLER